MQSPAKNAKQTAWQGLLGSSLYIDTEWRADFGKIWPAWRVDGTAQE